MREKERETRRYRKIGEKRAFRVMKKDDMPKNGGGKGPGGGDGGCVIRKENDEEEFMGERDTWRKTGFRRCR